MNTVSLIHTDVLNYLSQNIVIVDQQGRALFVNGAAAALFGQEPHALVGQLLPLRWDEELAIIPYHTRHKTVFLRPEIVEVAWENQTARLITLHDVTEHERLLQEVNEREHYFNLLMENAPDLLAIFDNSGTLLYINPAMQHTLGYSVEESTNQPLLKYFQHPRATSLVSILTNLPTAPGETIRGRARVVHKDGSLRMISSIVTCIEDPQGRIVYIANCRDITETIRQQDTIRRVEERFHKLLQVIPHPILLVRLSDWTVIECNDRRIMSSQMSLRSLVGTSLLTRERMVPIYKTLREEFIERGTLRDRQVRITTDGFDGWISIFAETIEYQGERVALISFVDISPHKQVEDELVRLYDATSYLFHANSLHELAVRIVNGIVKEFNQMDCGLILLDEDGANLVRVARAGEYGIALDAAIPVEGAGLVPQAFREGHPMYAPDVSKDESYVPNVPTTRSEFVIPLRGHGGVIGVLDFQSQVLDGFSESDRRLLNVFSERAAAALENMKLYEAVQQQALTLEQRVEERTKELSAALHKQRQLLQVKSRFVSMISHEYRTPLTVISSSASILERYSDRLEPEKKVHHLVKIQNQVSRLIEMQEAVVQLNRAEALGGMPFEPEQIDALAELKEIIHAYRAKDRFNLLLEIEGQPRTVLLDARLFRMIADNLISNAVKYSDDRQPVHCRLTFGEEGVQFQVADGGIGIPPDEHDKIFTSFYRAQNVGQIPGTGLGLPLVRQAVEAHNGRLHFESEVGRGTTFTVSLPTNPT